MDSLSCLVFIFLFSCQSIELAAILSHKGDCLKFKKNEQKWVQEIYLKIYFITYHSIPKISQNKSQVLNFLPVFFCLFKKLITKLTNRVRIDRILQL